MRGIKLYDVFGVLAGTALLSALFLLSNSVSADDSVVDIININVPVACSLYGNGMVSHTEEINNGTYTGNIGTTTLKAFCNDHNGFAIYAAGYTGNKIGETNSNKLVGTAVSNYSTIITGTNTGPVGNNDVSNWSMKLATTSPTPAYPITIDNSFDSYQSVPNAYTKVAHRDSDTDVGENAVGATLTTTYAAYIAKTQPADTYSGQVIYTLVHPSTAPTPVNDDKVGVTYNANGSTFTGSATTNRVVYTGTPMYIETTPRIASSPNVASDGTKQGSIPANTDDYDSVVVSGASKLKVVYHYDISTDNNSYIGYTEAEADATTYDNYVWTSLDQGASGTETFTVEGNAITFNTYVNDTASNNYGFYAQIYPVYTTEQTGTELSEEYVTMSVDTGAYAQTTNWYGSWYADINNEHYEFANEAEVKTFLGYNISTLGGTNINLYRSLTINEAYAKANKTQSGGYYIQQDMNHSICQTVAVGQNGTVKDSRDSTPYMIGKLKDGRCWMLNNLALDPTDSTTAANMSANNTNASTEAIQNYLNGGSSTTGWSNTAVANKTSNWNTVDAYTKPWINNQSKNTLTTSYGPASTNGQAKVGVYYNFCAATAGTYCYANDAGVDLPDTYIDAPQDICSANWRMPTGYEYYLLGLQYNTSEAGANSTSLQYNLSTVLSGWFYNNAAGSQGVYGSWWSSTNLDGNNMFELDAYSDYVNSSDESTRDLGDSIRCIVSD